MNDLERRYRLLLLAFPRRYRDRRGDEMVGTLMEAARPGQQWPSSGDAADLVDAGLQARTGLTADSAIGSVLGLAAPYGLAVAGGIASVCLVFGELRIPGIWHDGFQPNQFTGDRFETNAVPLYGTVVLAFGAMLAGRQGLARVLALAGCVAAFVSLNTGSIRGGNFHPPVDLLALLFVALLPAVVAPAVGRSLTGVAATVVTVVTASAAVGPARFGQDTRASFYADSPSRLIEARPYLVAGGLLLIVALVALAYRRQQWQLAAAAGLFAPPAAGLLLARPISGSYGHHYVLVVAFFEVAGLVAAAVVYQLHKVFMVSQRPTDG